MATSAADPAQASVLLAESVVSLARAELHLALTRARTAGERLGLTIAISALAVLLVQACVVVLSLTPVLWAFGPGSTLAASGLSLAAALAASLIAFRRWRAIGKRSPASASASEPERTRAR